MESTTKTYFSFDYRDNKLFIREVAKKPRGGAKATLEKIEKILKKHELSFDEKRKLDDMANSIKEGYLKKNFFAVRKDMKGEAKVKSLFISIHNMIAAPELPKDVLSVLFQLLPFSSLGPLGQTNKEMKTNTANVWEERAKKLGWRGSGGTEGAKKHLELLKKAFRHLHVDPEKYMSGKISSKDINEVVNSIYWRDTIGGCYFHSTKEYIAFSQYLYATVDCSSEKPADLHRWVERLSAHASEYTSDVRANVECARLAAKWGYDITSNFSFVYRVRSVETASEILSFFPNADLKNLLSTAIRQRNSAWIEAILNKVSDVSTLENGVGNTLMTELILYGNNSLILLLAQKSGGRNPLDDPYFRRNLHKYPFSIQMKVFGYIANCMKTMTESEKGAVRDIIKVSSRNSQPLLQYAIAQGVSLNEVKLLVELGCLLDVGDPAVYRVRSVERASEILSFFPNADLKNLLSTAIRQRNSAWIEAILNKVSDVSTLENGVGNTLMTELILYRNNSLILLLSQKSGGRNPLDDPYFRRNLHKYPFSIQMKVFGYIANCMKTMTESEKGAVRDIIKVSSRNSQPLLQYAIAQGVSLNEVKLLVELGCPLDVGDPAEFARKARKLDIYEFLLYRKELALEEEKIKKSKNQKS